MLSRTVNFKGLKDWVQSLEMIWKINFPWLVQRSLTKYSFNLSNISWP